MEKISECVYYCEETSTVVTLWDPGHAAQAQNELSKNICPSAKQLILLDPYEGSLLWPLQIKSDIQFKPLSSSSFRHKFERIFYVCGNAKLRECFDYIKEHYPSHKMEMLISCEFELLYRTQLSLKYFKVLKEPDTKYTAKYHFISLNAVPKYERAVVLQTVLSEETADKICYSWLLRNITKPDLKAWQTPYFDPQVAKLLDSKVKDIASKQEQVPTQYYESLIDTFVESAPQDEVGLFVTEKTWKPLMIGKVFWGLNSHGFYSYLESLGFRLYKNIFDYSLDTVIDFGTRANMHCAEIKRICALPIHEVEALIETHRDDIEHNKQLIQNWEMPGYPELSRYKVALDGLPMAIHGHVKDDNKNY